MLHRIATIAVFCAATALPAAMPAQTQPAPAASTPSSPSKSLDAVQLLVEKDWMGLAEAMPADKYDFAPSVAEFKTLKPNYTGVRTFGQEIAHVAAVNFSFAAAVSGTKPTVDTKLIGTQFDKATAYKNLADSFAALHTAIATLTPENSWETVKTPGNTRAGTIAYNFGHQRDHYGQLVEYLRMCGMVPPASQNAPLANPDKKS